MSVAELTKILTRAIEARAPHDASTRASVYALARRTLDRFLEGTPELSDAERARQRDEFELIIEQLELQFHSAKMPTDTPALSAPVPLLQSSLSPTAAALASRAPPGAAGIPSQPEPTTPHIWSADIPQGGEPSASGGACAFPSLAERPTAPTGDKHISDGAVVVSPRDAFSRERDVDDIFGDAPTNNGEIRQVGIDDDVAAKRNRRGAIVLIVLLLGMGALYRTRPISSLHHLFFAETGQTSADLDAASTIGHLEKDSTVVWNTVVSPRLAGPEMPGTTIAFYWDESIGPVAQGFVGHSRWSNESGNTGTRIGNIVFSDAGPSIDLAVERLDEPSERADHMMIVRIPAPANKSAGTPVVHRFIADGTRADQIRDDVVRIGVDRVVFAFRARPSDTASNISERTVWHVEFPLDDGRHTHLYFRLPPRAAP